MWKHIWQEVKKGRALYKVSIHPGDVFNADVTWASWAVPLPAPGCPPCFQSRNESSAVVQEVPQEQAADGCSKGGTKWHQCLNNPAENCIRKLLLHHRDTYLCSKTSIFRKEPEKDSLGEEPFQTSPSKQTQPTKSKPLWPSSSFWIVSAQSMTASLQESPHIAVSASTPDLFAHTIHHPIAHCWDATTIFSCTVLICYNCFQLHSVKTR